jgi:hypothetical protein
MDMFGDQVPEIRDHLIGWNAFRDLAFMGQMGVVLVVAVVLAVALAYHPSVRKKATTLEEFEQPKIFIMYSIVGAVIALIVRVQPSMALVIFGIGGLLRFRTDVGQAKDTGRVILVTVVGLCCGLQLYVVAVLATATGWVLIFALEGRTVGRLLIQGLDREIMARSASGYARVLRESGCTIMGEERRLDKGIMSFVYRGPRDLTRATLEASFAELPEDERGAIGWESA